MGFVHKGGVCCFLLLARVLLAAAAAGAEQDDGAVATAVPEVEEEVGRRVDDQGNDSCDLKCQHHQVPARKKQCVDECHSREHHHPSRASCETKCNHWQDLTRKEQCVQQCMRYGLNLHVGGNNGVDERPRRADDQGNDMCDIKCQHHQVPARKQQCVDECHSREHHHPSRASCEMKCNHWQDPTRKEQCVQQCMRYGLNLHVGGVDERPHAEEVEVGRRVDDQGNDSCDLKCQHHQVPARKKQCVDECHSREHHHPSRAACESKCSHWVDPTRKEQCVQQCMSYGLNLGVGGTNGVEERHHAQEEEVAQRADDQGNDSCDLKCQHHQVPARKKQCVDECHSREHHHPSGAACESKCSHWQDPTRKEQCVQQCMSYGLNLHVGGNNGFDVRPRRADDQGNDMCDIKCQHHQVPARKQQCVDECHSREHHHPSRASCEPKCSHWVDPTRKEQCVQQCMSYGLGLHVGGSNGIDEHLRGWEAVAGAIIEVV